MTKKIGDGDPRDFDETRRLLYMTLAIRQGTDKYNLVGTLANALVHHHGLDGDDDPNVMGVMRHLINVVEEREGADESQEWILGQIARITDELDD